MAFGRRSIFGRRPYSCLYRLARVWREPTGHKSYGDFGLFAGERQLGSADGQPEPAGQR